MNTLSHMFNRVINTPHISSINENFTIMEAWRYLVHLVPFVQFKKREKHPWMSVTFSKVSRDILIFVFVKFTNLKIRDVIIGIAT